MMLKFLAMIMIFIYFSILSDFKKNVFIYLFNWSVQGLGWSMWRIFLVAAFNLSVVVCGI